MMVRGGLLLAAALAACSAREPRAAGSPAGQAPAGGDAPLITLERRPCFGTCPVYTVTISRPGSVSFTGKQHVARVGEASASIPSELVDSLLAELETAGYFGFADAYVMDSPACGMYATDSPTVITSVTRGGETKTIRHDRGCSAAPPELSRLEQRIDEVAGTRRWIERE